MALRCVGNQCLRTDPVKLLAGQETASLSMWVRINFGSGDAAREQYLFGHAGSETIAVWIGHQPWYSGSGRRIHMSVDAKNDDMAIETAQAADLIPGLAYHVAIAADRGVHRFFLNGKLLSTQEGGRVIGLYDNPRPIAIGLENGGGEGGALDVTIDDPTAWVGHALTSEEVVALRDRIVHPEGIAADRIAWRLTLDGADGAGVAAGDPGLAVASGTARDAAMAADASRIVEVFGEPTYEGGVLSYLPPARLLSARIGPSRKTLLLTIEDVGGNPTNVAAVAEASPALTIDGVEVPLGMPYWNGSCPILLYFLAGPVPVGATAALDAPEGWARAATGDVAALAAAPVDTAAIDSFLPPFDPSPKSMAVGWNVRTARPNEPEVQFANWARKLEGMPPGVSVDDDGYPTDLGGRDHLDLFFTAPWGTRSGTREYRSCPDDATWTVRWKGPDDLELITGMTAPLITRFSPIDSDLSGPVKVRRYAVAFDPSVRDSISLGLRFHGAAVRDVEVYDSSTDLSGTPPTFHAEFLRKLAGAKCVRFMDAWNINTTSLSDYEGDFWTRGALSYAAPKGEYRPALSAIRPYDLDDEYYANIAHQCPFIIEFDRPHGLKAGQVIGLDCGPGRVAGLDGHFRCTSRDGADADTVLLTGVSIGVRVLSPTTISASRYTHHLTSNMGLDRGYSAAAGELGDKPGVGWGIYPGIPVADICELVNILRASPWISFPLPATDACMSAIAAEVASRLAPGLKARFEWSNECWNNSERVDYCASRGSLEGLTGPEWYAKKSDQVRTLVRRAFEAAGRDPDDAIVVLCGVSVSPGNFCEPIAAYCEAKKLPIDEFSIAPYFSNDFGLVANDPTPFATLYDAMDVDQQMDYAELGMLHAGDAHKFQAHREVLDGHGFAGTPLSAYEGGPETGLPGWTVEDAATAARNRRWARHPRMRGIMLHFLDEIGGYCSLYNNYILGYIVVAVGGPEPNRNWSAYLGWDQPAGKGDGSDGLFDNRADYEDMQGIVSVVGGAMNTWAALANREEETPATAYAVEGPGSAAGDATFVVRPIPDGATIAASIEITPSDGEAGGTFTPPVIRLEGPSPAPVSFTYGRPAPGTSTLVFANDGGLEDPGPRSFTRPRPSADPLTRDDVPALATALLDEIARRLASAFGRGA